MKSRLCELCFLIFFVMGMSATFANTGASLQWEALLAKKNVTTTLMEKQADVHLKNLSDNYYFVFIYKGACPHCHNFAPIVKDFTDTFHIKLTAYTLDKEELDGFQGNALTPELFQTFFISGGYKPAVPALFLVNRHTLEAYAVLFGEAKDYELANRVSELMKHIEEKFHV